MRTWMLVIALAPLTAAGQSHYKCTARGNTWYQEGPCAVAQPTDLTLRKCIAPGGAISIQNEPCPARSKTAWVRPTAPEVLTESTQRRLADEARRRDAQSRELARAAGTDGSRPYYPSGPTTTDRKRAACDNARRHREDTLRRVGMKRTYNLLRELDERVYEACK